jgi:hypothetical protein
MIKDQTFSIGEKVLDVKTKTLTAKLTRLENLADLDRSIEKVVKGLEDKFEEKVLASELKPGFDYETETRLVLPDGLLTSEDPRATLILLLLKRANVLPYLYRADFTPEQLPVTEEKILDGLILELNKPSVNITKISRSVKDVEFGRAIFSATRVKRSADMYDVAELLVKNQFLFGNGTGQDENEVYCLRALDSISESFGFDKAFVKINRKLIGLAGLECNLLESDVRKFMIPFKEYITTLNRPIYTVQKKSKKTVISGYKKPKKPSRSPVFTKLENEEFSSLLNIFWDSMKTLEKEWTSVSLIDLKSVQQQIRSTIKHRFSLLENYGKVTTKRLEKIRRDLSLENTVKKKDVTGAQLSAYEEHSTPEEFLGYVRILLDDSFKSIMEYRFKVLFATRKDAEQFYLTHLYHLYECEIPESVKYLDPTESKFEADKSTKIIRCILTINRLYKNYERQRETVIKSVDKPYKAYGAIVHMINTSRKISHQFNKMEENAPEDLVHAKNYLQYGLGIRNEETHINYNVIERIKIVELTADTQVSDYLRAGDLGQPKVEIPAFLKSG